MKEMIWVRIETTKGNEDIWSLKGQIECSVFDAIVNNCQATGYFKLSKVYWINTAYDDYGNAKGEKLYEYGKGKLAAYHGDLYLRVEHVVSIAPIDGESELARYRKKEEPPLSVVSPIRS